MHTQDIEYHADGARLVGRLFVDETRTGRRPGVLVAPEGLGLSEHTYAIAQRLAEAGYVAFAMDYYGDGGTLGMDEIMPKIGAFMAAPETIRARAAEARGAGASMPRIGPVRGPRPGRPRKNPRPIPIWTRQATIFRFDPIGILRLSWRGSGV